MVTRKALLVGIDIYKPPAGPNLNGCVNDVRCMASTLAGLGIVPAVPATMRILTNANATKANIINGLKWLIKGAKKGDVLIFFHSGHGTQVADVSGDEIDHKDEALCPHDIATAGALTDDELRKIFSTLTPGANLDVILDTCHSGTGTRDIVPEGAAAGIPTIKYMEPPADIGFFLESDPSIPTRKLLSVAQEEDAANTKGPKVIVLANINHVLWAACRDAGYSYEVVCPDDKKAHGAYTCCFCKLLKAYYHAGIKRAQFDGQLGICLKKMQVGQVNQTEGTRTSMLEKMFT